MNSSNFVNSFNIGAPGNLDQSLFGLNQTTSEQSKPSIKSKRSDQDFKIKKMKSTQEGAQNVSNEGPQDLENQSAARSDQLSGNKRGRKAYTKKAKKK